MPTNSLLPALNDKQCLPRQERSKVELSSFVGILWSPKEEEERHCLFQDMETWTEIKGGRRLKQPQIHFQDSFHTKGVKCFKLCFEPRRTSFRSRFSLHVFIVLCSFVTCRAFESKFHSTNRGLSFSVFVITRKWDLVVEKGCTSLVTLFRISCCCRRKTGLESFHWRNIGIESRADAWTTIKRQFSLECSLQSSYSSFRSCCRGSSQLSPITEFLCLSLFSWSLSWRHVSVSLSWNTLSRRKGSDIVSVSSLSFSLLFLYWKMRMR
jgi:hypothetical protein